MNWKGVKFLLGLLPMLIAAYFRGLEYASSRIVKWFCQKIYTLLNWRFLTLLLIVTIALFFHYLIFSLNLVSVADILAGNLVWMPSGVLVWIRDFTPITLLELCGIILLAYLLVEFIRYARTASTNVAIDEFKDFRKRAPGRNPKGSPPLAEDLNDRLVVELDRICTLYHNIAESMYSVSGSPGMRPQPPRIIVETPDNMQTASQVSQSLTVGPVNIPMGLIRGIISSFMKGVRVVGFLFEEDNRLQLVVHKIGPKEQLSWTVTGPEKAGNATLPAAPVLDSMIQELACKMFASMELKGSHEWKAVRSFNQGLEEYLHSKTKPHYRVVGLRRAEKKFIEALSEDKRYHKAYYNLGVIYYEQKKWQAAERAFISSLQANPNDENSYYALALNYFQEAYEVLSKGEINKENGLGKEQLRSVYCDLCRVIELCDVCLSLQWPNPEAYELKGFAYRLRCCITDKCLDLDRGCSLDTVLTERCGVDDLENAIRYRRTAVQQSWGCLRKRFIKASLLPSQDRSAREFEVTKDLTYKCLNNFAYTLQQKCIEIKTHSQLGNLGRVNDLTWIDHLSFWLLSHILIRMYRQALDLKPSKANPHLGIGVVYLTADRPDIAARYFRNAVSIDCTLTSAWVYLALAYSKLLDDIDNAQKSGSEGRVKCSGLNGCTSDRENISQSKRNEQKQDFLDKRNYALKQILNYIEVEKPFHLYRIIEDHKDCKERPESQRCWEVIWLVDKALKFLEYARALDASNEFVLPSLDFMRDESGEEPNVDSNLKSIFENWLMGEWYRIHGVFLLKCGKPVLAEQMFQKALDMLKSTYPERVRKNSIHASLSHAQIRQKDYLKAITAADNGLSLDPRCFYAHLRRGQGFYGINDLDRCVEEYYFALQCDPEQPEVYFRIGQVNLLRAQRSHDPNEKRGLLSEAFKYFKMALDFHESGDRDYAKMHYWLGKSSLIMGSYNEARTFFETAEAVFKTVDPADIASIKTTFHLGEAHLGMGMFASSSFHFKRVHHSLEKFLCLDDSLYGNSLLPEVEDFLEDGICTCALRALCHIRCAIMTELCKSDGIGAAQRHLDAAEPLIQKISNPTASHEVRSEYLCAKGWLLLKGGEYSEAIEAFQQAHIWKSMAQSYWYMARAYYERGMRLHNPQLRKEQFLLASECCDYVKALDFTGRYTVRAEQMLSKLKCSLGQT